MNVRAAKESEIDRLAEIWYDAWQDAHAEILPAELARLRTLDSFRQRLHAALSTVRVADGLGQPAGFCITKGDELYQLFVSASARGSGVAVALIEDAESRMRAEGIERAWLACAIGNEPAARFYEKRGWYRVGEMVNRLDTTEGEFLLDVWRYEKDLG
jgi:GNAT superfamily N-acetyltransferase